MKRYLNLAGPDGANLFVHQIPFEWTERDLYNSFAPFGQVVSCKIFADKGTGQSRGFGMPFLAGG